jgi:hypothetical protein
MPPGSVQSSPLAPAATGAPYTGTTTSLSNPSSNGAQDSLNTMVRDGMEWVRSHPLASVLAVTGLGVAVGVAIYEMAKPAPTPKQRAVNILKEIRDSLANLAEPTAEYATQLGKDGKKAAKKGMHAVADSKLMGQLRHLFS